MTELAGITWDHPRGYAPLRATAEAYGRERPDVSVRWDVRTLQEFADAPIEKLAERYDLLVIDHPFVGFAAADGCLLPLDELLEPEFLAEQARNSVGRSHPSYEYDGHQWALAIDAAAQVSAHRPDLLEAAGVEVPGSWDDVLALAESGAVGVAVPLIPVDVICTFQSICANVGEEPFGGGDRVVSRETGRRALELMARLAGADPRSRESNPIRVLERMSTTDEVAYCPLLFGYSNYARPGWRPRAVRFGGIPDGGNGPAGAILGGTGLAISAATGNAEAAAAYTGYVASPEVQRGMYVEAGGQPGHRSAWVDPDVNVACGGFFADTLDTLDRSYLRPRFDGFLRVQEQGGDILYDALFGGSEAEAALDRLDALYLEHAGAAAR